MIPNRIVEGMVDGTDYLTAWDEADRKVKEHERQTTEEIFTMEEPDPEVGLARNRSLTYDALWPTSSTLKIDQSKLFAACNHDARTMGLVLALLEAISGERVEIKFSGTQTDGYVEHYRKQFIEALGILT
jgi:hypothetical protein